MASSIAGSAVGYVVLKPPPSSAGRDRDFDEPLRLAFPPAIPPPSLLRKSVRPLLAMPLFIFPLKKPGGRGFMRFRHFREAPQYFLDNGGSR